MRPRGGFTKVEGLVVLGVLAVLSTCLGCLLPIDLMGNLGLGWAPFLYRVAPNVRVDTAGLATGLACLGLFAGGAHAFLRWLWAEWAGEAWRARWTGMLVAGVVLMFVAGLGASGVVHQVGWLLTSGQPIVAGSSGAAYRAQSANNLKQMGMGLHNYNAGHDAFPPAATFDGLGRPMHGWQARLLPYIEQASLYDSINFSLPWRDPRNAPPYRAEVEVYLHPAYAARPARAPDAYAESHYAGNARVLGGDRARAADSIADGLSNTIFAGEVAGRFRPWGDPVGWRDPALGLNRSPDGFGGPSPGGANFLFGDGSVRFLKNTIAPSVLEALSTPDGRESIRPEDY